MDTQNENFKKLTIAEISKHLGWTYADTQKVKHRKSPKEKYHQLLDAEEKIFKAKQEAQKTYDKIINDNIL